MDTCFAVDERSFYDITSEDDLKELWETELDPAMQEALRLQSSDMTTEWYMDSRDIPGVILHDRLMTDAALGTRPIKTEHSYSLASDGDSLPDSPLSHHKMDDMDDECLPAISMKAVCERLLPEDELDIKDEPFSESDSPHSSCPSSPQSHLFNPNEIHLDIEMSNPSIHTTASTTTAATLLKSSPAATRIFLTSSPHAIIPQRIQMKIESPSSPSVPFHLPPTPPSCSSGDDSEDNGNVSRPPSPVVRKTAGNRLVLSHHTSTRQPIHTPLISSQPKGSTGTLILTEEEKRTLIAEGYPVPTRLPLTKAEEKSLKKIRRKIKNKISAQESRRKKKEYMDQLERKVEILVSENTDYKKKIENLEDSNNNLLAQLQKLQAIVSRTHPQLVKTIVNN